MGIVVCLLLGVTLMLLKPLNQLSFNNLSKNPALAKFLALVIFNVGFWNAFVYGVREVHHFWGLIGIWSGVLMILASLIIFFEKKLKQLSKGKQEFLMPLQLILSIGLMGFFLLYLITLIRINLGMSIF